MSLIFDLRMLDVSQGSIFRLFFSCAVALVPEQWNKMLVAYYLIYQTGDFCTRSHGKSGCGFYSR